jgi:flagellar biosynthesis/type III secretory pathway chaperone
MPDQINASLDWTRSGSANAMDETLLARLREGIREEIAQYEELLDLTTQEHHILADETYSTELATVAAKKLRIMRDISDLVMRIGPLKVRWKLEDAQGDSASDKAIKPLLEELGTLLERILDMDEANQEILARLVDGRGRPERDTARGHKDGHAERPRR